MATRDYQDGYQVDKGQFEEVLSVNKIRKSQSTFLLPMVSNFISVTFFATRDYQDGYQVDKGQFEEVLLVNEIKKS